MLSMQGIYPATSDDSERHPPMHVYNTYTLHFQNTQSNVVIKN